MNLAYEFIQILADMNFLRVFEFVADSLIFGERVPLSDSPFVPFTSRANIYWN